MVLARIVPTIIQRRKEYLRGAHSFWTSFIFLNQERKQMRNKGSFYSELHLFIETFGIIFLVHVWVFFMFLGETKCGLENRESIKRDAGGRERIGIHWIEWGVACMIIIWCTLLLEKKVNGKKKENLWILTGGNALGGIYNSSGNEKA